MGQSLPPILLTLDFSQSLSPGKPHKQSVMGELQALLVVPSSHDWKDRKVRHTEKVSFPCLRGDTSGRFQAQCVQIAGTLIY